MRLCVPIRAMFTKNSFSELAAFPHGLVPVSGDAPELSSQP